MEIGDLKIGEVYSYYGIEYAYLALRLNGGYVFNPIGSPSKVLVVFWQKDIERMKYCPKKFMTVSKLKKDKIYTYNGHKIKGECLGNSLNNGKYRFLMEDGETEYSFTFGEVRQFKLVKEEEVELEKEEE